LARQREIIDAVYNQGLNDGDLSVAEKYLTPDYRSHGSYDDSITGPASFRMTIEMQHVRSATSGTRCWTSSDG